MQANMQRLRASEEQYAAIQEDYQNDDTTIDLVLESQRRVIDGKLDYFRAQVEFMLAVKAVHFEKGTVLNYHNVALSESGWSGEEYRQALDRERRKSAPLNYVFHGLKVSDPLGQLPMGFVEPVDVLLTDGSSANESKGDPTRASLLVEVAKRLDEENDPKNKIAKIAKKFSGQSDASAATESLLVNKAESSDELQQVLAEKKSLLARLHAKNQTQEASPAPQVQVVESSTNSSRASEGIVANSPSMTTEHEALRSITPFNNPINLVIDPLAELTSLPPVPSASSLQVGLSDSAAASNTIQLSSPSSVAEPSSVGGMSGTSSRRLQSLPQIPTGKARENFSDSASQDSVRVSLGDSEDSFIHR
jgi:hypothetical protein